MTKLYISHVSKESQFSKSKDYCVLNNQNKKKSKLSHLIQKYHTFMQFEIPHLYVKNYTNNSITSNNKNL